VALAFAGVASSHACSLSISWKAADTKDAFCNEIPQNSTISALYLYAEPSGTVKWIFELYGTIFAAKYQFQKNSRSAISFYIVQR
jgi:hypothetical protein